MTISFDEMCRQVECKNYIEWEHEEVIRDHNTRYVSDITCVSCTEVGQSYNIDKYPECCPHKVDLEKYKRKQEKINALFLKKSEQEKIWKKLNAVDE